MSLAPRIDRFEKNAIINGNLDFWQRGTTGTISVSSSTTSGFVADRMQHYASTSANGGVVNYTASRSTNVPTFLQSGFQSLYSLQVTNNTSTTASVTGGNNIIPLFYRMEGLDYARYQGKRVLLSFWFQSSVVGTYSVGFYGFTSNRTYTSTFNVSVANTWTRIVVPVTMENLIAGLDTATALQIMIGSVGGSSATTSTLNAWQTGFFYGASTATNWAATAGAVFRVSQIQLLDASLLTTSTVPSFSRAGNNIGDELQLCQRYYEKSYPLDVAPGTSENSFYQSSAGHGTSGNQAYYQVSFKATKRAIPSCQVYRPSDGVTGQASQGAANVQNSSITHLNISAAMSTNSRSDVHWTADAEL